MKRIATALILALISLACAKAQNFVVPEGYEMVDSIIFKPTAAADSTLVGKDVFAVLNDLSHEGGAVNVKQSSQVRYGMQQHISQNGKRSVNGYRIRIFFDNKQDSRSASEEALHKFQKLFHGVSAYRSFSSPYFKVTVGDFRTRSEAMQLLEKVKWDFPTAFIVRESINYPVVDKEHAYITDTLYLIRKIVKEEDKQ